MDFAAPSHLTVAVWARDGPPFVGSPSTRWAETPTIIELTPDTAEPGPHAHLGYLISLRKEVRLHGP